MTPVVALGILLACASFAIATALGWIAVAMIAPVAQARPLAAGTRAVLLAQLRLLPLACVAIIVPAQISAFVTFEAGVDESAGALLWVTATAGLLLALHAIWCATACWRDTARVISAWKAAATPLLMTEWSRPAWSIRRAPPIVAVTGVFRPQLFVAHDVVNSCTPGELAAIAAHEAAHIEARDNLVRLLFRLTPGARLWRQVADRLERQWNAAAEEAADQLATRSASAIDLASALTKVARLVSSTSPQPTVASAFIGGSDLRTRVHRLLEISTPTRRHPAVWAPYAGLAMGAVVLQSASALAVVHELFELLVNH